MATFRLGTPRVGLRHGSPEEHRHPRYEVAAWLGLAGSQVAVEASGVWHYLV